MKIEKKNEVYIRIETEPHIARELSEYFTFEVPGARFMPSYRNKVWDGKIRLFSVATGQIYLGLLPYIREFCKRNDIRYELDFNTRPEDIDESTIKSFIKHLKIPYKARDYQISSILSGARKCRGLFVCPTASGKSLIIYGLTRWCHSKNLKTLILVPTTSLVEQMSSDFLDYGWLESYIQKVYSGHSKKIEKDVVISTWQSLHKFPKKYFEQFGCVIGDEAHLFKAKSLTSIMTKLHLCKYRFGLTGTLDDLQTHKLVLEGLFGTTNKVISTKELIEKKTLSNLKLVSPLKGNTLVLYQYVEKHGKPLYDLITNTYKDRKVFFVSGGVDALTREEIRALTEKSKDAIIVASYGTFSTGINIKNLHNIIFSSPSKSKIRVLQSIGRGLRLGDNKTECKLFDIADDFSYKNRQNFTLRHFMERINIYNEEQFDYTIHRIKL
jgi:superfamily II DNA or RNA helicase